MKLPQVLAAVSILVLVVELAGCSSAIKNDTPPNVLSAKGPNILNARSEPENVTLNRDLQPTVPGEVLADVKDFKYPVSAVEVKFHDLPLSIEMEHVAGSTWKAEFTPQQLQILAVSGKTMTYKADIVATNSQGDTGKSPNPLSISVTAPERPLFGVS